MKKYFKRILKNIFSEELKEQKKEVERIKKEVLHLNRQLINKNEKLTKLLNDLEVSLDYNPVSESWMAVSLQGKHSDFVKFVPLTGKDISEVMEIIKRFNRKKVDAIPPLSKLIKIGKL